MSDSSSEDTNTRPTAWLRIDTAEAGYADTVVADLARIVATPSGRSMLEQVRASGRSILIEKPVRFDPPNADVRPRDLRAATDVVYPTGETDADGRPVLGTGEGSDCLVTYDPADWPNPTNHASPPSDVMLFGLLYQALIYLDGAAEPLQYHAGLAAADETEEVVRYRQERDGG
jgi:hypothetical protein